MEELLNEIQRLALTILGVKALSTPVINDIRIALTKDALTASRLPTATECTIMIEGCDEDEDVQMSYFTKTFPHTLIELESLWQLR